MQCSQCGSFAGTEDRFCRQCGSSLTLLQRGSSHGHEKQGATLLLVYLCWSFFMSLVWLGLNKLIRLDTGFSQGRLNLLEIIGVGTQVVSLLLLIIFAAVVRSSRIRIFFIIFTFIEVILILGYRVFKS